MEHVSNDKEIKLDDGVKFKVKELTQTSDFCPSQWEGFTDCGKHVYIRYRCGWLSAGISVDRQLAVCSVSDNEEEHEVWSTGAQVGGTYDGRMTTEEMKEHLLKALDFSECIQKDLLHE